MARAREATPFAKILCRLMLERRVTIRVAAEAAGVGISTIMSWRSGSMPENYLAVRRLARALGVSFSFLLTGEEDGPAPRPAATITEVFVDDGVLYDGYAQVTIKKLKARHAR